MRSYLLVGGLVFVSAGLVLTVVGFTWQQAYSTEHQLTVAQVLRGEPGSWLAPGPIGRQATVTGLALLSQPQPATEEIDTRGVRTKVQRYYFPLRVPEDNRALLVSLPTHLFNDNDPASYVDKPMTLRGLIGATPALAGRSTIEHQFSGVTFPSSHCLFVGEEGQAARIARLSRGVGAGGIGVLLVGAVLLVLRRGRGPAQAAAEADQTEAAPTGTASSSPAMQALFTSFAESEQPTTAADHPAESQPTGGSTADERPTE